ncbi:cytochrome P450 2U1-like [Babylonia areolata]|uniref:cytochrome P450 2U1-like n=1 Tax=Babylonia areolata TaxID=304850 RepID=UPI003FD426B2
MPLRDHVTVTCVLVGGAVGVLWWLWTRRPHGIPPGPGFALPLLGHLHLIDKDPRAKFHQWRKQFGDIFSLYLGRRLVVVFCGYSVIKDAFSKSGDSFADRPHLLTTDQLAENKGIVLASGPEWREQRKTALEILRQFGLGRNELAEKVQVEVIQYVEAITQLQGQPVDLHRLTTVSVANNISYIIFGTFFHYDDPTITKYFQAVEDNFRRLGSAAVVNFFPFLQYLPGDLFGIKKILSNMRVIREEFLQPHLDAHLENYREMHPTDFMYAYLYRMKQKERNCVHTSLCERQLSTTAGDLVITGTETTTAAILWALLLLLNHPDVQEKCYEEINRVVGTSRLPNVEDRKDMDYLEATIQEVLRFVSIGTFAVQHAPPRDVVFRGYTIPRDTIILPFMDTVLHDPEVWEDPEAFCPDRFIFEGRLTTPQEFIPFGTGRRACLGESLARMELFLYLSMLLQRFHFLPAEPDVVPPVEGILGATHTPKPYKIRAVRRETETENN